MTDSDRFDPVTHFPSMQGDNALTTQMIIIDTCQMFTNILPLRRLVDDKNLVSFAQVK